MVLPAAISLVRPTAVCLAATAITLQNCNEDTTDEKHQDVEENNDDSVHQSTGFPSLGDSAYKRQLKRRVSVSFHDDALNGIHNSQARNVSSISNSDTDMMFGNSGKSMTCTSIPSIDSKYMKSVSSRDRNTLRESFIRLRKSNNEESLIDAPYGFIEGDFASGKVVDVNIPQGCFVMEYHPVETSLLAVGLLNGGGVAIFETTTYNLVDTLYQEDSVSALAWLRVEHGSDNFSLLAVGCLNGKVSVFRMHPNLLELKGADLVHHFQVNAQIRAINLCFYGCLKKEVVLAVGDTFGDLTFSRYTMDCSPIETRVIHSTISAILSISTTSSGSIIAIGTKNGDVSVYRIQRDLASSLSLSLGSQLYSMKRHGAVHTITFSMDEKRLVFGGYDKSIIVVDTFLWAESRCLKLDGTINSIAFDPLDRYLAVGCRDKSLILYDTSTFFALKTIRTSGWVTRVSWASSQSDILAIRSELSCISILDLSPIGKKCYCLSAAEINSTSVSFSFDGRFLARSSGNKLIISDSFIDFSDICESCLEQQLKAVSFCHEKGMHDHLAVITSGGTSSIVYILKLSQVDSKVNLYTIQKAVIEDDLWTIAWSFEGNSVATGGRGRKIFVLNASDLKPRIDALEMEGRIWSIAFTPLRPKLEPQYKNIHYGMVVGSGDYIATLFETENFQPTLKILRPQTVRCVSYHPTLPLLAIGDGGNIVSIVDFNAEDIIQEINVAARVNVILFSPQGDIAVVGTDDCIFLFLETKTWRILQEIPSKGFASCASFSGSGKFLALGSALGTYNVIQLGPFLALDLVPLTRNGGISQLPESCINEVYYRSGNGYSLVQRYMLDSTPESLRRAATLINTHADTIYCFNRDTGDSSFDTALKLKKPNLLKLVMTTLVDGTLERDEGGRRSILTSSLPERGRDTLEDMILNSPSDFVVSILSQMVFIKVPFTEAREIKGSNRKKMERGSASFTDPWKTSPTRSLERIKSIKNFRIDFDDACLVRTPAILPLPGLGTLKFLSSLLYKTPPTVFDNPAMGLVLRVMWGDYIKLYFLLDLIIFLFYGALWVCLIEWTSATTSFPGESLKGVEKTMSIIMIVFNTIFAAKELRQSRSGKNLMYWRSIWNWVDTLSIVLVYVYSASTIWQGGVGTGNVPLAVVTTLLLTLKLLSYLRGFDGTGWLISVLVQSFIDVQGFMVVLLSILLGFTTSFRLLFGKAVGKCFISLDQNDGFDQTCDPDPFNSFGRSLLSTLQLTILGNYDDGILEGTEYTFLAIFTFVVAILCVFVVTLNALIAVLSDSYARVQENAVANRRKERAELIVEYLSIMPTIYRKRIEDETQYFHALLEADEDGDLLINKEDWEGGLNALRKDLEDLNNDTNNMNRQALEELQCELTEDLNRLRLEVMCALQGIAGEVQHIKTIQSQGGVTFNGRNVARAVRIVKEIGKRGIFQPIDQLPWKSKR
jgi:WD40 repeat protein